MGWEGSHLYQFIIASMVYGDPGMLGELDSQPVICIDPSHEDAFRQDVMPSELTALAHERVAETVERTGKHPDHKGI
jgi:hypothetical protein